MTNMRKIIHILFFYLLFFCATATTFAQENTANTEDIQLKDSLYTKYRNDIMRFTRRDFDDLFLEFFRQQNNQTVTLSKEEFYTYTIKIAIYSERLGLLYKDRKDESLQSKQEWFNRNYSDYLNSKK
jgi:isocitrate dehydrogenase